MTCGIYLLTFVDGCSYVGKSVHIEQRWSEHRNKLEKGTAATKMQQAFNRCGPPGAQILMECHEDHIDLMETHFIMRLKPNLNVAATKKVDNIEALSAQGNLLKFSTAQHVQGILEYIAKVEVLEAELIEKDFEVENVKHPDYEALEVANKRILDLEKEIRRQSIDNDNIRKTLKLEQDRKWYHKLFK